MKAIIQIQNKLLHNSLEFLSPSIFNLELCGKKLLSYYFDLLNELGAEDIFIFSDNIREFIPPFYLSKVFSPNVHLIQNQNVQEYQLSNKTFFDNTDLLKIENIGFIFASAKYFQSILEEYQDGFICKDNNFELSYIKTTVNKSSSLNNLKTIKIKALETLEDYINITHLILKHLAKTNYALGYSQSEGIVLGKNVTIDETVKLIAPLVIQDNVNISKDCTLGPNVIISNNVFIENNTNISNSIVYDNTYIGSSLNLNNKLIQQNNIIDKVNLYKYEIDSKLISKNN